MAETPKMPGGTSPLALWVIQMSTQGMEVAEKAIENVTGKLNIAENAAKASAASMDRTFVVAAAATQKALDNIRAPRITPFLDVGATQAALKSLIAPSLFISASGSVHTSSAKPLPAAPAILQGGNAVAGPPAGNVPKSEREIVQKRADDFVSALSAKLGIALDKIASVKVADNIPVQGGFVAKGKFSRGSREIQVNRSALSSEKDLESVLAHELGHALDMALGGGKKYASHQDNPQVKEIINEFKKLAESRGDTKGKSQNFSEYYNRPHELFANAVREHITGKTKSGKIENLLNSGSLPKEIQLPAPLKQAQLEFDASENSAKGLAAAVEIAVAKIGKFDQAGAATKEVRGQIDAIGAAFQRGTVTAQVAKAGVSKALADMAASFKTEQETIAKATADSAKKQEALAKATEEAGRKMAVSQMVLAGAYAYTTSKILGWVNAGLAGTTEGNRLAFMFERLHREIASVFAPIINATIEGITKLVTWFHSLDGEGQKNLRMMGLVSVALLGVSSIVPLLGKSFESLGKSLSVAFSAHPIIMAVSAMGAILLSTEKGRASLSRMGELLSPISKQFQEMADRATTLAEKLTNGVVASLEKMASVMEQATGKGGGLADSVKKVGEYIGEMHGPGGPLMALLDGFKKVEDFFGVKALGNFFAPEKKKGEPRQAVTPAGGGFMSNSSFTQSIQEGVLKTDIARTQRDKQIELMSRMLLALERGGRGASAITA